MPSQYPYRQTIRNEYLGVSKVLRATSAEELDWLIKIQLSTWREQETRKQQRQQKEMEREAARQYAEDLKWQAEKDTDAAQKNLDDHRNILSGSLQVNLALDWDQLLGHRSIRPFQFNHPKPDRDQIRLRLLGPQPKEELIACPAPAAEKRGFLEFILFPLMRKRFLQREREALEAFEREKRTAKADFLRRLKEYRARETEVVDAYNFEARSYNEKLKGEKEKYICERDEFLAQQEAQNRAVLAFRSRYEAGEPDDVERCIQMALEQSSYPELIPGEPDVSFDAAGKILIVGFWLPSPEDVPKVLEYKYIASRKAIKPVEMKQKEFDSFYDDILHQIALRTMREVFGFSRKSAGRGGQWEHG
jgi:restriction system protein